MEEQILKQRMINEIEEMFRDDEYGFDAFIRLKPDRRVKRFLMYEGAPKDRNDLNVNFKKKMQLAMAEVVKNKYASEEAEYDSAENIADNQKKFYVIKQDESYHPFSVPTEEEEPFYHYRAEEREYAEGVLFCFRREGKAIWAYQYFYQNAIPNRSGRGFHIFQDGDVFTELKEPLLMISRRIDLLLIGDEMITDDIQFLQKNFGFRIYIENTAAQAVAKVQGLGLVTNSEKLEAYIRRSKPVYAKKMMRIRNSRVLQKTAEELYKSVTTLPRWKGKFEVDEASRTIVLRTFEHVENLIDLLDERYTRSDVTGEEYDTGVKKWIAPAAGTDGV